MSERRTRDPLDALLRESLRRSVTQPPAGFARELAARVADAPEDAPEDAELEINATRALVSLGAVAAGGAAILNADALAGRIADVFGRAPWPLLLVIAATLGAIRMAELIHRRSENELHK